MWNLPVSSISPKESSSDATKKPTPVSENDKKEVLQQASDKQDTRETTLGEAAAHHPNPIFGDQALFLKGIESIIDIAIYVIDTQGIVRTWGPSAARIKGYTQEEILGQHYSKFYLEKEIKEGFLDFEMREARENGHYIDKNWRIRKDGTRF